METLTETPRKGIVVLEQLISLLVSIFRKCLFCDFQTLCYFLDETGLSVRNVAIRVGNTEFSQVCGYAWQYEMDKNPGKLLVEFHPGSPPGTYWILGTDYDNYACVYR